MQDPTLLFIKMGSDHLSPVTASRYDLDKLVPAAPVSTSLPSGKPKEGSDFFGNEKRYLLLQKAKDQYKDEDFLEARNQTNPFEKLGNAGFINRAPVKLANIDAVFGISTGVTRFCDVASGPGGFTQYLQRKLPESTGYGITLRGELDFNLEALDAERFFPFYGESDSGDLYREWLAFSDHVANEGLVDLVTADGCLESEENPVFSMQEEINARLILCEISIASRVLQEGGTLVCKVFDTVRKISADTIFLTTFLFKDVRIFKPISSRPGSAEKYLVCRGFRHNEAVEDILWQATSEESVPSLLGDLPQPFIAWLSRINDESTEYQIGAAKKILKWLSGKEEAETVQEYDIGHALIIWGI